MSNKIPAYAGMTAFLVFQAAVRGFAKVSGCLLFVQQGSLKL
ncbi:MAG: hypothetical protein Q4A85_05960 [Kingella sp. (in: b-proteobacteria)]|nr:hypothetical protein [Kingella sp. (in: b-proteobacteria)]